MTSCIFRRSFLVAVVAVIALPLSADRLIDFGFLPSQSAWSIFAIDPVSGSFTPIVTGVTAGSIYGGGQALDPVRQRFFFLRQDTSELFTVNLLNQQVDRVPVPSCCSFLQYDVGTGRLLGFGFLPSQSIWSIFAIDPASGSFTPIVTGVTAGSIYGGGQALDPVGQRFFFLRQDTSELFTVNLQNQQVTRVPVPSCCAFLQYDVVGARLLGFGFLPSQSTWSIFAIDPASGSFTPIVTGVTAGSIYEGGQAFDSVGQRFFFVRQDTSELFTVNLQNQQITRVNTASCCGFLSFQIAGAAAAAPLGDTRSYIVLAIVLIAIALLALHQGR